MSAARGNTKQKRAPQDPRRLPPVARWVYRNRLALIVLGVIPIIALGLLAYHATSGAVHGQVRTHQRTAALITGTAVEQALERTRSLVESLADLDTFVQAVSTRDEEGVAMALRVVVESYVGIEQAYVTDPAGFVWNSYPEFDDPVARSVDYHDWFERVAERQTTIVSRVFEPTHLPGQRVVTVGTPVRVCDEEVPAGYLFALLTVDSLDRWLQRVQVRHEGDLYVLDQQGTIAAFPDPIHVGEEFPFVGEPLLREAHQGIPGTARYTDPFTGVAVVASTHPIRVGRDEFWTVVAQQSVQDAEAPIRSIASFLLIAGGFVALAAIVVLGAMGRTQRWLLNTERFVDSIVENIPDMIFVKEARHLRFVRFNVAGEKLLGYNRKELLGKSDYDFFPKKQADYFVSRDREVLKQGKSLDIPEEPIQTRNRGLRYLHTKKVPIHEGRRPAYLLGISEDITERKLMETERELIWTHSLDLLSVVDLEGRFVRVNPSFERLFGYRQEEIVGQHAFAFVHPDDRAATYAQLERMRHGESVIDFENRYICKDGSVRWLSWRAFPHGDYLYSITRDVTPRREELERCEISERALVESDREIEQLALLCAAAIEEPAHDALRCIDELRDMLKAKEDEQKRRMLEDAQQAARHLERLFSTIRNYANVTRRPHTFSWVDLENLAQDVVRDLDAELHLANGTVRIANLPTIRADAPQMRQLLRTMLEHSLAFRRHDLPLHIEFFLPPREERRDGICEYYMRDTGLPFAQRYPHAPESIAAVPEASDATQAAPPAWGLDLLLCRRILRRHGGTLEVIPTDGGGATYRIELPCR